jgi:hypothetical protein
MAIIQFLGNPTTIMELVALVTALLFLPSKHRLYPGALLYYLLLVILVEALGFYLRTVLKMPNVYLYNGLNLVQALFFSWLFYRYQAISKTIKGMGYIVAVLIFIFAAETLFRLLNLPIREHYNKYFRILLGLVVVTCSLRFYFSLLRDDSVRNPLAEGKFWIVTGLFFFYLCSTPMSSLEEQVAKIKLSGNISFYTLVMGCINVILYGCWVIAFICLRKNQLSRPSSSFLPSLRW